MCHRDYADQVDRLLYNRSARCACQIPFALPDCKYCIFLIPPPARNRGEAAGTCLDMLSLLPAPTFLVFCAYSRFIFALLFFQSKQQIVYCVRTYTLGKASGPAAWRLRTRQRQNARQIRVRRSKKRGLRELAAGNVEECFGVCSDQGLHLDLDINIGSHMDHSRELS